MLRSEGFHIRRQVPFRGYILDFACFKARLVIEVDGEHHGHPIQMEHDRIRDAVLAREGFRTVRIQNKDVLGNLSGVLEYIREALQTPPSPSWGGWPEGSGGGQAPAQPGETPETHPQQPALAPHPPLRGTLPTEGREKAGPRQPPPRRKRPQP